MGSSTARLCSCLAIGGLLIGAGALQVTNGVVDDEHDAIVVEASHRTPRPRERAGRQLSWLSAPAPALASARQFPASTGPLQGAGGGQLLCRTPTGQLSFCQSNYQWGPPGGGWRQWGQPQQQQQQWGQQQQQPQQFQWPQGQYPAQYPGPIQGQYPPGAPGWPQQGFPGQGGAPSVPGYPEAPSVPGYPEAPSVPVTQPPPATHPPFITHPPTPPAIQPVVVEPAAPSVPQGSSPGQCGVGRYYPIRYNKFGTVAEEQERIDGAGGKIVNGWAADQGEWPWIAALLNNDRQFCGGSLISRKHILTAAHCVAHMTRYDVASLKVRLGEHRIKQDGETNLFESKAARVVRHREFSQQTLHKDVAIITMEDEVPLSQANVRPVCLAAQGGPKLVDQTATVVGWGLLNENGPMPDILQEVTVRIWDNKVCKETYGPAAPGGIMDHMLCAGQKGKDSCSGDSGGPMQIGTGDSWTQIGVVSWGIGCGKSHYPGVYSRISELRDWIDRITEDY